VNVKAARGETEATDAVVDAVRLLVHVARDQRVVGIQLIVDAGAQFPAVLGCDDGVVKRDNVEVRIEDLPVNDGVIVDVAPLVIEEEGGLLTQGAAEVGADLARVEIRLDGGKRVAGVECSFAVVEGHLPAKLVGSGFGENLDASESQAVVFGRERVLVNANFADGRLGGKTAAGESIDKNLAAVGACRRTGQGLKIGGEVIGVS